MRGSWGLALAVVGSLFLAGCSGGSSEATDATGPLEGETSPETGAIVGTTLDTEALPIPGVAILLLPSAGAGEPVAQATSDEAGRFRLDLVPPGNYRAEATAATYRPQSLFLAVKPEATVSVTFTLSKAEGRVPYHFTIPQAGQVSCAAAAVVAPTAGLCPQEDHENRMLFAIPDGFAYIVAEAAWDAGNEHLAQYFAEEDVGNNTINHTLAEAWGGPALRAELSPGLVNQPPPESLVGTVEYGAVPEGFFILNITTFYAGQLAEEVDGVGNQVCQNAYGRCAGVGATLSLRYENFITVFMHRAPADPASFTVFE